METSATGGGSGLSVVSDAEVQPRSEGKSILLSASLSKPSEHSGRGSSIGSVPVPQSGSLRSIWPSASLSVPSAHWVGVTTRESELLDRSGSVGDVGDSVPLKVPA